MSVANDEVGARTEPQTIDKTADQLIREMGHSLREVIEHSVGKPYETVVAADRLTVQLLKAIYRSGESVGREAGLEAAGETVQPASEGSLGPASSVWLNKWLVNATLWAQGVRDEIGERSYMDLVEFIPWVAHFVRDGITTEGGRIFSRFSVSQMLQATGWGPNAEKRLLRTSRIFTLSATADDGADLAETCQNLLAKGIRPIIEPLGKGCEDSGDLCLELVCMTHYLYFP